MQSVLHRAGSRKVNGRVIPVFTDGTGRELVEQVDARTGVKMFVTIPVARKLRDYPLGPEAERVIKERFGSHMLEDDATKRENVRKLLHAVIHDWLGAKT